LVHGDLFHITRQNPRFYPPLGVTSLRASSIRHLEDAPLYAAVFQREVKRSARNSNFY